MWFWFLLVWFNFVWFDPIYLISVNLDLFELVWFLICFGSILFGFRWSEYIQWVEGILTSENLNSVREYSPVPFLTFYGPYAKKKILSFNIIALIHTSSASTFLKTIFSKVCCCNFISSFFHCFFFVFHYHINVS